MKKIDLYYISVAYSTKQFVNNLVELSKKETPEIQLTGYEVSDANTPEPTENDWLFIVPTYRNGIGEHSTEELTNALSEWGEDQPTLHEHLIGIVGTGSQRYGGDFVLTARQYAQQFDVPLLAIFEMPTRPVVAQEMLSQLKKIS